MRSVEFLAGKSCPHKETTTCEFHFMDGDYEHMAEVKVRRSKDLEAETSALLSGRSFPVANLERRHPINAFDILLGLPPYGPMAPSFPEHGRGLFSEGLVVRFTPFGRNAWIGNFNAHRVALRNRSGR
jgi:hypothetical protein